jgi:aspartate racemase
MKTLGLIGGTSWISTIEYYRLLNERINQRLGGLNFARCVVYSLNYADIAEINRRQDWDAMFELVGHAADGVRAAGAEALLLGANTMHLVAERVQERVKIPLIHIADATARVVRAAGLDRVALLGTRYTMEQNFFMDRLTAHGVTAVIPNDDDRAYIHGTIFDELGKGIFLPESKTRYLEIIDRLVGKNGSAQGAILGCTEIPLLINSQDTPTPLFDTTSIHVDAAVDFALA